MLYIPTLHDIESLKVGDMAMDCFGNMRQVVEVDFRGVDIRGKTYVNFKVEFGPHSTVTQSYKEDELVRHVGTSKYFNSWQLDDIEAEMLAKGERVREL